MQMQLDALPLGKASNCSHIAKATLAIVVYYDSISNQKRQENDKFTQFSTFVRIIFYDIIADFMGVVHGVSKPNAPVYRSPL